MAYDRILAMKLRSMGDTVIMTAALTELRAAYPSAEIHVAVTDLWAPLLKGHPAVDKILTYTRYRDTPSRAKAIAGLAIKLRKEHFDCVVNFHASPSSAMVAFATGAKVRSIHFHGHRDRNRYSTTLIAGKGTVKPIVERDMDAIRALGIDVPEGRLPSLKLDDRDLAQAEKLLASRGVKGPVLAIAVGASRPTKMWPMERFAAVARAWRAKTGGGVIAVGAGESERELVTELSKVIGGKDPLVQILDYPIREMAAILAKSKVVVGNDSGPRHIAVAVGTPTVTLIGPEHPLEWHPYPRDRHPYFYLDGLACRRDAMPGMPAWCGLNVCVEEKHRCMLGIQEEPVITEVLRVSQL